MKQKLQGTSTTHFFGNNGCFVSALTKASIPMRIGPRFLTSAFRERCQFCLSFFSVSLTVCLLWSERTRRFWSYSSPSILLFGKGDSDTRGLLPARAPEPGRDVCQQGSLSIRKWEVSEQAGKGGQMLGKRASQWADRSLQQSWVPSVTGRSWLYLTS